MVLARAFLIPERMVNNRPKPHGRPAHIVSFAIKQIFNTMKEREPKSEDEGRIF
jgi:hypothetical protein